MTPPKKFTGPYEITLGLDRQGVGGLDAAQIRQLIEEGFVRVDNAFPQEWAAQGRKLLWRDTGCDPDDTATWTKPVIRLGYYDQEPFRKAVNTPKLHSAFDQLVGLGRWLPRYNIWHFSSPIPEP